MITKYAVHNPNVSFTCKKVPCLPSVPICLWLIQLSSPVPLPLKSLPLLQRLSPKQSGYYMAIPLLLNYSKPESPRRTRNSLPKMRMKTKVQWILTFPKAQQLGLLKFILVMPITKRRRWFFCFLSTVCATFLSL